MNKKLQRKRISQGVLPYKIGLVARLVFPALARQGILSPHDVSFLISGRSGSFFATRSDQPVLRQKLTGDRTERFVDGFQRYYGDCIVPFGGCEYYLTKEWWNDARHINLLLLWLLERGLDRAAVIQLCEQELSADGAKRKKLVRRKKRPDGTGSHDETTCCDMKVAERAPVNPSGTPKHKSQLNIASGFCMCRYVKAFFAALEEKGFSIPKVELDRLLSKTATKELFHVWLAAFVEWDLLVAWKKDPTKKPLYERYWKRQFVLSGRKFAICGQWYAWQKDYFDCWASGIAAQAGVALSDEMGMVRVRPAKAIPKTGCARARDDDVVTIDVRPLRKHTVSLKRK